MTKISGDKKQKKQSPKTDAFMQNMWNEGTMSYLIFTRIMSFRGNPYIKGVFILNDSAMTPSDLDCVPLSEDCVLSLVSELQEELSLEQNGAELGSLPYGDRSG